MTQGDSGAGAHKSHSRECVHEPHSPTRHIDLLYRAAWAMCGSPEDAEDLVRETFARVLSRRRARYRDHNVQQLFQALRDTFSARQRSSGRPQAGAATLRAVVAEDRGSRSGPQIREVYASIAELPEDMRHALVAADVLGFTCGQAARALGVSEETVTARLLRARTRLAAELLPRGRQAAGI